jgi:RHS repeat-associated protein
LTAKATDNGGATTTSAAASISVTSGSQLVPRDGLANVSYDQATNRINTSGWEYDAAGNQTRLQRADLSWQRHVYDAAGRLVKVQNDVGQTQIINTYGASNHRLIEQVGNESSNQRTYYAWVGDTAIAEYEETVVAPTTPRWVKSYVYLGARLLATINPNGASERVEYHHPDRLGTRLVSNNQDTTSFEQAALPFGTALDAESTGSTKRRFTSYDRSTVTGLDYAVNRHYDPLQGRFTQVDPIGMRSTSLVNPQTLNLYAYCANDPINHTDPSGLGFFSWLGKLFRGIGKIFSAVGRAVAKVLNNRWVRIGVFIASFLLGIPAVVGFLGKAVTAAIQTGLKIYNAVADIASALQLTGQLLQGKFKELGISLGLGVVSAAISTIADGVIRGVTDALKKNGKFSWSNFSFKGFFGGAWSGLKRGLNDVFGRGWESLIPVYGRYCGPGLGNGGGGNNGPAVSGVDELCNAHDDAYLSIVNDDRLTADIILVKGLFTALSAIGIGDIAFAGHPSGGNVSRFLQIPAFSAVILYRKLRP